MKKGLLTLIACIATLTTAMAQQAGDYFYTSNGRYQITTGENLLPNGDFADGTSLWTTDSGDELDASIFSIEPDGPDGNYYLHVLYKEDGPGTSTTLLRRLPVVDGTTYYISYMVKAEQEVTTSVSATDMKNYQNIFFNTDGSLTPEVAIAKPQDYSEDWRQVVYAFHADMDGDVVFHIYGSYTGTCFDAFKVMEASRVVDDREVDALINRLQAYIDNPLFPNAHELLEEVIVTLQELKQSPDYEMVNEMMAVIENDAIKAFLDENSIDITNYLTNGTFDDLPVTGDNQTKAGAWTINDKLRENNPTAKTRWSVKSATETGAPFSGNYLQDNYPYKYILREATVHQTLDNMPAATYMFQTKARAWVWKATDVINEDSVVSGLKTFINDNYTECYPIHYEKATAYDAYGTLTEAGPLKVGFFLTDSVAAHIDLDVEALRIIGWTQDQVDEYFMGREFAETRQALKDKIDEARSLLTDVHYFYAKPLLTDSINRSQGVYDQSHDIDSIANQTKRMTRAISYFKGENAEYTPFVVDIEQAEDLLADAAYTNGKPALTAAKDAARAFLLTLDAAVRDSAGITDQHKLLLDAINTFMIANTQADEAYLLLEWAKENPQFIVTLSDEPSENAPALYPLTSTYAGHDLQGRFAFLPDALVLEANADYGLTVNLPGKNQNVMAIDNLGQGDQVVVDWAFANPSHGLYVTSANASYTKADGTVVTLTKTGKDSSNLMPNGDNQDGLNGYQRTTFTMTAPGALQFYLGSSNSTLRISYVGINYADTEGVASIDNGQWTMDNCYDLQGRAIKNCQLSIVHCQLRKGLYIIGGKKVFIK